MSECVMGWLVFLLIYIRSLLAVLEDFYALLYKLDVICKIFTIYKFDFLSIVDPSVFKFSVICFLIFPCFYHFSFLGLFVRFLCGSLYFLAIFFSLLMMSMPINSHILNRRSCLLVHQIVFFIGNIVVVSLAFFNHIFSCFIIYTLYSV